MNYRYSEMFDILIIFNSNYYAEKKYRIYPWKKNEIH